MLLLFEATLHIIFFEDKVIKKSPTVGIKVFFKFLLYDRRSGAESVPHTNGSGYGEATLLQQEGRDLHSAIMTQAKWDWEVGAVR